MYLFNVSNDRTLEKSGPPKDRNCSYKITLNQNNKIKIPDKLKIDKLVYTIKEVIKSILSLNFRY